MDDMDRCVDEAQPPFSGSVVAQWNYETNGNDRRD